MEVKMPLPHLYSPVFGDLGILSQKIKEANDLLQNPKYDDTDYHTKLTLSLREVRAELEDLRIGRPLPPGITEKSRRERSKYACGND
jgi:hypothetical protein